MYPDGVLAQISPFDFSIIHGVFIPLSSKSIILAPCDSTNFPDLFNISISSFVLNNRLLLS